MTLVHNISDNSSLQQTKQLKDTSLVKTFKIAPPAPEEPDTNTFSETLLVKAEAEFVAEKNYAGQAGKELSTASFPRLDRTKFKAQSFEEADHQLDFG
jgi:hypothetical protein